MLRSLIKRIALTPDEGGPACIKGPVIVHAPEEETARTLTILEFVIAARPEPERRIRSAHTASASLGPARAGSAGAKRRRHPA